VGGSQLLEWGTSTVLYMDAQGNDLYVYGTQFIRLACLPPKLG